MTVAWGAAPFMAGDLVAAAVGMLTAIMAWRRRGSPGAAALAAAMVAASWWCVGRAFSLGATTLQGKLAWADVWYVGVPVLQVGLFVFAIQYWQRARAWPRWLLAVLAIHPVCTWLLLLTNPWHHLFWARTWLVGGPPFPRLGLVYGPADWASLMLGDVLLVVGLALLVRVTIGNPALYRRQVALVVVGVALPLGTSIVYFTGRSPIPYLDLTPESLAIGLSLIGWALLGERLLDIVPVAHHLVIDSMDDLVFVLDGRDRIVYLNRSAEEQAGQLLGQPARLVLPGLADLLDGHRDREEVQWPAGSQARAYDLRLSRLPRQPGREGRVLTLRDVTDLRRAQEALAEQARELARSNAELEQFASAVSHELSEPLRTVASFSELLAKRYAPQLDPTAKEFIGYAVDGTRRMQQLLQGLLTYARAGAGDPRPELVDCNSVLADVCQDLRLLINETGARVACESLPVVYAARPRLRHLFGNLMSNAVKFRGPEPLVISVGAEPDSDGGGWLFSVRDNGIGIEPRFSERIFLIFERLHARDEYPGTGLGLALCKKIVEHHGGRIWVESQLGQGSSFYFTLPRAAAVETGPRPALEPAVSGTARGGVAFASPAE